MYNCNNNYDRRIEKEELHKRHKVNSKTNNLFVLCSGIRYSRLFETLHNTYIIGIVEKQEF